MNKHKTDVELLDICNYLIQCNRLTFRKDFFKGIKEWYKQNTMESTNFACYVALDLWENLNRRGMIETMKEYAKDSDTLKAFVHAINK